MVALLLKGYWVGTKPLSSFVQRFGFGRSKKRPLMVVLSILLVLLFAYFLAMLTFTYWGYQNLGMMVDKPYLGLFLAALVGTVGTVVISFSSVSNILYGAPDIRMLSPLPIEERALASSRLLILYLLYAPLYAFMTLPAFIIAAWIEGVGATLVLAALANLVFGPLLPLAVVVVAVALSLRLGLTRRFPSASKVAAMLLFMLFFIALSALMTRSLDSGDTLAYDYQRMLTTVVPLFDRLERYLPLLVLQAQSAFSMPTLLLSLLILSAIGGVGALSAIPSYHRSIEQYRAGSVQRKRGHRRSRGMRSPVRALVGRELVILKSESAFIFEAVGELLIPLILLVVWTVTGTIGDMALLVEALMSLTIVDELLFLILMLVSNMTMISSTSVSREGRHLAKNRLYPLKASVFVDAKLLFHLALVGGTNLIYLASTLLLAGRGLASFVWMAPLSLLTIAAVAPFQLAIDYHNPNEEWTLAQHAMKSNPNGLFGLLVSLLFVLVDALFLIVLPLFGLPAVVSRVLLLLVLTGSTLLGYRLAVTQASRALAR
jgi:ABC-2 type transport system permease protein